MTSKKFALLALATLAFCMGCQPAKSDKTSLGVGRLARSTSATQGAPNGKVVGSITSSAGDSAFYNELYLLTYPTLSSQSADEQLGYVSSQDGQATGVRFWGNAVLLSSGQVDTSTLAIHIDIYDDKTGTMRADGSIRPDIPIQISPDQPTYQSAGGTVAGGQAQLYFQDLYGTITMQGQISGSTFSGTISYVDDATGGITRTLGNFTVQTCGFFVCQ